MFWIKIGVVASLAAKTNFVQEGDCFGVKLPPKGNSLLEAICARAERNPFAHPLLLTLSTALATEADIFESSYRFSCRRTESMYGRRRKDCP